MTSRIKCKDGGATSTKNCPLRLLIAILSVTLSPFFSQRVSLSLHVAHARPRPCLRSFMRVIGRSCRATFLFSAERRGCQTVIQKPGEFSVTQFLSFVAIKMKTTAYQGGSRAATVTPHQLAFHFTYVSTKPFPRPYTTPCRWVKFMIFDQIGNL